MHQVYINPERYFIKKAGEKFSLNKAKWSMWRENFELKEIDDERFYPFSFSKWLI